MIIIFTNSLDVALYNDITASRLFDVNQLSEPIMAYVN